MRTINVLIIVIILAVCGQNSYCEVISESSYLKVDEAIWAKYEDAMQRLSQEFRKYPEKRDSLRAESNRIYDEANAANVAAAIKYVTTPSGIHRLFMVRLDLPKEQIKSVLDTLTGKSKESKYYKGLIRHVETSQLQVGDQYSDLNLYDSKGKRVKLSNLIDSKKTILIFGGLDCMGKDSRNFLRGLIAEGRNMILFVQAANLNELKGVVTSYPMDATFVSDFNADMSEMKIIYGTQATPTVFIIDGDGKIIYKETGIHEDAIKTNLN